MLPVVAEIALGGVLDMQCAAVEPLLVRLLELGLGGLPFGQTHLCHVAVFGQPDMTKPNIVVVVGVDAKFTQSHCQPFDSIGPAEPDSGVERQGSFEVGTLEANPGEAHPLAWSAG